MVKKHDSKRFIFILKVIACLLITNSHCRAIYPYYFLAIGGGFGNAIFLLISGYLLAYPKKEFGKWYPTRLKRILIPTVFLSLISVLLNIGVLRSLGIWSFIKWLVDRYWFAFAICIYYPIFYFIFRRRNEKISLYAMGAHISLYLILYAILITLNPESFWIESDGFSPIKVFFYLGVMVFGGYIRQAQDREELPSILRCSKLFYFIACALSFVLWTAVYFAIFVLNTGYIFQIFVPVCAAAFAFSLFKLCMAYESNRVLIKASDMLRIIAESTLEIYLVQVTLVQYCEKLAFPLNAIAFWASAILLGIAMHLAVDASPRLFNKKKGKIPMKEKILILNGSFCEIPLIEEAKKMGYYVITTGNAKELIGHKYSDEYIPADYSDKEAILEIVKKNGISHVVSCANDFGVLTAAFVAEKMGWSGHDSYETAKMLHHKDLFKEYANKKGLPSPISVTFCDADKAKEYVRGAEYPIIVKATDLTGGKGIRRADNADEAIAAVDNAFGASRSKHIVIEPFITGVQQTFVTFLVDKKVVSYTGCNSYSPINPYLIQSETLPAENMSQISDELCRIIEKMAEELKLADGVFAFQLIRNGKSFNIIEMMRRPFGNQFLQLVEDNTDFPWHRAQILAQTGKSSSGIERIQQKRRFCGHHGIMAPRAGIVKSYDIPQNIKKHIYKTVEMCPPGNSINNCMNERVAYIFYEYESLDEMNEAVVRFNSEITVEMI